MNLFLDANVLVAVLNKEYPVFSYAARVLSLADRPGFRLFTSPLCIAIAWYFAAKKSGSVAAKKKITLLCTKISLSEHRQEDVEKVCTNPAIEDVEDGLEYLSALHAGCNYLITENTGDFHFSAIPVFDCRQFLETSFLK
jgi:predicted nucleic acid-binding protein